MFIGELAALGTSILWASSSTIFSLTGKAVGGQVVNRMRLLGALILVVLAHWLMLGTPLPFNAEPQRWFWLGLSGFIGLVLGDIALFEAYVLIGARLSTLVMAGSPVLSTVLAWLFLGEMLTWSKIAGILLSVGGIALVVLDHQNGTDHPDRRKYGLGVLLAVIGAIGQAGGLITAKQGLVGNFSPISAVVIRLLVAAIATWLIAAFAGKVGSTLSVLRNRKASAEIGLGTLVGPVGGIWLSMIAVQAAFVGVASTLMSLSPIILLPVARYVFKEKVTFRAVLGTFICLAGVVVLFL